MANTPRTVYNSAHSDCNEIDDHEHQESQDVKGQKNLVRPILPNLELLVHSGDTLGVPPDPLDAEHEEEEEEGGEDEEDADEDPEGEGG